MRGSVAVLIAAALLMPLLGCSQGAPATLTPATSSQSAQTPSASTVATSAVGLIKSDAVPKDLRDTLTDGHPVLIFFFKEGDAVSKTDSETVNSLLAETPGLVDEFSYEVNSAGTIELASLLGVSEVPAAVLIDRNGAISYRRSGLIDDQFLRRELFRAAD